MSLNVNRGQRRWEALLCQWPPSFLEAGSLAALTRPGSKLVASKPQQFCPCRPYAGAIGTFSHAHNLNSAPHAYAARTLTSLFSITLI